MKRLLFQAVFLAMGMIMGVYASGDVGLDLMCGALVACVVPRWGIRVGFVACDDVDCHA